MKNEGSPYRALTWEKKNMFSGKYILHNGSKGIASVKFSPSSVKYRNAVLRLEGKPDIYLKSRYTFTPSVDLVRDGVRIGSFFKSAMHNRYTLQLTDGSVYSLCKNAWVQEWTWYNSQQERVLHISKDALWERGSITVKEDLSDVKALLAVLSIYAFAVQQKEFHATLLFVSLIPVYIHLLF